MACTCTTETYTQKVMFKILSFPASDIAFSSTEWKDFNKNSLKRP